MSDVPGLLGGCFALGPAPHPPDLIGRWWCGGFGRPFRPHFRTFPHHTFEGAEAMHPRYPGAGPASQAVRRGFLDANETGGLTPTSRSHFHRAKAALLASGKLVESKGMIWRP
jgi:hypothetical protein